MKTARPTKGKLQWSIFLKFHNDGRIEDSGVVIGAPTEQNAIGQAICFFGILMRHCEPIAKPYPKNKKAYDKLCREMGVTSGEGKSTKAEQDAMIEHICDRIDAEEDEG
jgi:hypothetical protein